MDILKIFSFLNDNNIKIDDVVKLLTTIFGDNQNNNSQQQSQSPPPQTISYDANNPYWSTPTYDYYNNTTSNQQNNFNYNNAQNTSTMQSIVPYNNGNFTQKTQNFEQNSQNNNQVDIAQIIKIVLPLLQKNQTKEKQKEPTPQAEVTSQTSQILKLPKT